MDENKPGDLKRLTELRATFDLIVDYWMPCCIGVANWPPGIRWYETISTCPVPGGPAGALRAPAGSEAFVVLMAKNCHSKWEAMYKFREIERKDGPFPTYSKNTCETTNKEYDTLYSDSCCGQNAYGGWRTEGVLEFKRLQALVTTARKDKDLCKKVEDGSLERMKALHSTEIALMDAKLNPKVGAAEVHGEDIEFIEEI